jgi:hypothetical protein
VLHDFATSDGVEPICTLTYDRSGNLYGTTSDEEFFFGPFGSVFTLLRPTSVGGAWTFKTLYTFTLYSSGAFPTSGVIFGSDGALYGTTSAGGACCSPTYYGAIFRLAPPATKGGAWTQTVIHSFGSIDGEKPGGLVLGSGGVMYGPAQGPIFELTP